MTSPILEDLKYIIANTPYWQTKLNNKKIFITGGTGFIGKWLLESIIFANKIFFLNVNITVLTRNSEKFVLDNPNIANDPIIHLFVGDIRDFDFINVKFDFIIHAATEANAILNIEEPLQMSDVIVKGTRHLLDFAVHCQVERVLYLSSGAVYGDQPTNVEKFNEKYTGAPSPVEIGASYAESKRMAEFLCATYARQNNISISIARCFAFVGPYLGLDKHYAIGNFINDGLNGRNINISGDGTPLRSYMYASDMTIWLWNILLFGNSTEIYNVGSEQAISIKQLAFTISNFFPNTKVNVLNKIKLTDRNQNYIPDTKKTRTQFGIKNEILLEDAIYKTINFHKDIKM